MFNKNKSVFDKINDYLAKKGHELVMSIFLNEYNGNNIYIRFDFIRKLSVYKIVWVDLKFFDEKHIDQYINMAMVTKFLSLKIVEKMLDIKSDGGFVENKNILGDRVEILTYFNHENKEYIFDRFLPLEWEFLIDPLAMIFTYLPRSMEVFVNEMIALFTGESERYNYLKPYKFDILNSDLDIFKTHVKNRGEKYFEEGRVKFLEKFDDRYIAIVEGEENYIVLLHQVDEEHVLMLCNCQCDFHCKHIYAVIKAIREDKKHEFYKVKYTGREESILEMVTISNFYLSMGIEDDKIILVTLDGSMHYAELEQNGKVVFEVLEDDDDCTLSKQIEEYKKK